MDTLDTKIADLLLHYKPEDVMKSVKTAQEKAKKEAEERAAAKIVKERHNVARALMPYLEALNIDKDLSNIDKSEIFKAIEKTLADFEKNVKNGFTRTLPSNSILIKEFIKNMAESGWF